MGYKPKSKESVPTYHKVSFDYGTKARLRGENKVTREAIPEVNLDETIKVKDKKTIRKILRDVIHSEYMIIPKSSNIF